MAAKTISLELTADEALVLFEFLVRVDSTESFPVEDEAEQNVLWRLEGKLEKLLTEPLRPNYQSRVAEARRRVRGETD